MNKLFKALVVTEESAGKFDYSLVEKRIDDLPEGDVLIEVKYSSLNYKDALSFSGNKGVTRNYPHTPGIDAAGIVVQSTAKNFQVGEEVIVTGFDLGMNTAGGLAEYIRVPVEWVVPLPKNLSLKESMIFGTAGFTAALAVNQLIKSGIQPTDGPVLVTGASGGVGSLAISILNKLNFDVVAATGKIAEKEHLLNLGAKEILKRTEIENPTKRALLTERWAGAVDTLGGVVLSNMIKSMQYGGSIACCGNITSGTLETSIYPFILRGISLLGIDSVQTDAQTREEIWTLLADEWKARDLEAMVTEIELTDVPDRLNLILKGQHVGRTIVNLNT